MTRLYRAWIGAIYLGRDWRTAWAMSYRNYYRVK